MGDSIKKYSEEKVSKAKRQWPEETDSAGLVCFWEEKYCKPAVIRRQVIGSSRLRDARDNVPELHVNRHAC
jgi:hypothetical protein